MESDSEGDEDEDEEAEEVVEREHRTSSPRLQDRIIERQFERMQVSLILHKLKIVGVVHT